MLNKTLFLEIDRPNYVPIYTVQYDYNSRFYEITILNNSQPLDLTGIRVIVAGKKPDGKEVFNSCKVLDAKKGLIQLELTEQMNGVNGASEYALELFSADGMLSSQPFKLIVTRSTISKSVESSKELGALKDALNEVQDIDNRFAQTNAQLSNKINRGEGGVITNAMLSQEVKETMTGGSVAVVGEDTILTNNIVDNQVTPCKTSFLRSKFRMTQECVRLGDNSRQDYDKAVDTTWFIPLTGQDTIKVNGCRYLYFYDENKDYVDRLVNVSNEEPFIKDLSQHPILSSACYVRVGIHSSLPNPTIMINGVYYDDYETELNNEVEESQNIFNITTDGMNLFNKDDEDIEEGYITDNGSVDTSQGGILSGFIEVEKGERYFTTATYYCAYYDKYKHFLFKGQNTTIKEVPNCNSIKYIRISGRDNIETRYFRKYGKTPILEEKIDGVGVELLRKQLDSPHLIKTNSILKHSNFYPIELRATPGVDEIPLEIESEDYFTTDYLPIKFGDILYSNKPVYLVSFHSETGAYLGKLHGSVHDTLKVATSDYSSLSTTKLVRLCYSNEYKNSAVVTINEENQIMELNDNLIINQKDLIKSLLPELEYFKTNNLLYSMKLTHGKALTDNGGLTNRSSVMCSDFIPVSHDSTVIFNKCKLICCYNSNKQFLGRFTGDGQPLIGGKRMVKFSNFTYDNDGEVAYFRIDFYIEGLDPRHDFVTVDEEVTVEVIDYGVTNDGTVFRKSLDFGGANGYRIPFMTITNQGTIIAGSDIRYNNLGDQSLISIGTARSVDGGKTWTDKVVACPNSGVSNISRAMDGTILATSSGRVFLLANHWDDGADNWLVPNTHPDPNWSCKLYRSDDDGRSWQLHQDLSHLLKENQCAFIGGVGTGIEMSDGKLVFPIQVSLLNDTPYACQSGIIYSSDGGDTWIMSENLVPRRSGECSVVEYPTGTILLNARDDSRNQRAIFTTTDLGVTWKPHDSDGNLNNNCICQGHTYKINHNNQDMILFSNPVKSNRDDVTLKVLVKNQYLTIDTTHIGASMGYSCLAYDSRNRKLYCVYEIGGNLVFKDLTDLLTQIQMTHNLNFI